MRFIKKKKKKNNQETSSLCFGHNTELHRSLVYVQAVHQNILNINFLLN